MINNGYFGSYRKFGTAGLRTREDQYTRNYKELLDAIDEMKHQMIKEFTDMPKAMALVIHHHATMLIDDLWHQKDDRIRQLTQAKLAQFFEVIYDDTQKLKLGESTDRLPKQTLSIIRGSK